MKKELFITLAVEDRGCPPQKLANWLKTEPARYLFFRIAVMEVESWVMADRKAFARFFSVPVNQIPTDLDAIQDPKQILISLVKRSRSRRLRRDIVPSKGSTATMGPDYNGRLSQFVINAWDLFRAEKHSESLCRCVAGLKEFGRMLKEGS